ncbi:MAG: M20/M25/M40 family metallo-hydrolase [Bacteroidales bacterium]|nr:M20/M25/M40 family metallo-hydrolase [Bacteroidales bacterium]MBQ5527790.1 M20/M25/M40 family metallo-hydrolase [Bacteroidales bacterium]
MSKVSVKQAVELLRKMVAIPSTSFHEEEVGAFVLSFLRDSGIEAGMVGKNIVARSCGYDPAKPTLMLCAHMDTVEPAADYSFDPFKPQQPEDRILGLGSNDDGGSVVSMISVFSEYREKDLPINLLLALTVEEERSGPEGMRSLWGKLRDEVDFAIVGEPTGMRAATSERGLLVIDGVAEGVAGHAARGEGVNALYIALDDISALRSHVFPKVSPVMGKVGLNVTQISAGTAHNVIPDRCSFVVDIRPTEQYDNAEILEELQALCKSRLTARNLLNRSSATRPDSPLAATAAALGIETFSSPTTSDWMRISCDAIKMGPGDSSRSHHKDEYVTVAEIEEAVQVYGKFIESFAYGRNTVE